MPFDITRLTAGLGALKTTIDIIKSLLPKGEQGDAARLQLENAERQLQFAEAQVAEGFGYEICKCEFPPSICTPTFRERSATGTPVEVATCPKCKQEYPRTDRWYLS